MKDSLNVAIAGATGYIGLELIEILSKHPKVKILYLCANKSVGKTIYTFDKGINKKNLPKITKIKNVNWRKINILFTSLPNGKAQKIANLVPSHVKLIDLSADFRLNDLKIYKFEIYPKTKNYPSEDIELFLKNYNLSDYKKNNSFFYLMKFFNEIFKEINKV